MKRLLISAAFISMLVAPATGFAAGKTQSSPAISAGQGSYKLAVKHPFGLGVILGEPTGITGKYWLSPTNAIDFSAAWSFANDADLHLHADYLFHVNDAFDVDGVPIHFYYGAGARFKTEKDNRLGVRIPVGLEFIHHSAPIEFFMELAPILDLVPETTLRMNAALGARYFF